MSYAEQQKRLKSPFFWGLLFFYMLAYTLEAPSSPSQHNDQSPKHDAPPKAKQKKIDQPPLQPACKPKNELQYDIKQIFRLLTVKQIPEKEEDDISSIIADEFHKACLSLEPQLTDLTLRIVAKLNQLKKKPCVVDIKKIDHFDVTLDICREGRDPLSITVGPQDLVVAWAILKRKALCLMFAKRGGLEGSDVEEFCGKRPPQSTPPPPAEPAKETTYVQPPADPALPVQRPHEQPPVEPGPRDQTPDPTPDQPQFPWYLWLLFGGGAGFILFYWNNQLRERQRNRSRLTSD